MADEADEDRPAIPESMRTALEEDEAPLDFSVEMETGTGKTYVYLRTIAELNKKYGIQVEYADLFSIFLIISFGNTDQEIKTAFDMARKMASPQK